MKQTKWKSESEAYRKPKTPSELIVCRKPLHGSELVFN
jgi:hypothetical protein